MVMEVSYGGLPCDPCGVHQVMGASCETPEVRVSGGGHAKPLQVTFDYSWEVVQLSPWRDCALSGYPSSVLLAGYSLQP